MTKTRLHKPKTILTHNDLFKFCEIVITICDVSIQVYFVIVYVLSDLHRDMMDKFGHFALHK